MPAGGRWSFHEQFAGGLRFSWPVSSAWTPSQRIGGWRCGDGGRSRGLPRTFRSPVLEGEGRQVGAVAAGGVEARFRRPNPTPLLANWSRSKAGRTGSLNFPSVCWGRGTRRADLGAISHASPPRLPAHSPAPCLEAGWGWRLFLSRLGRRGRKLANEGQKGWGGGARFFKHS